VVPGMVLHAMGKLEHEGTSATKTTATTSTVGDGPTMAVVDDTAVPLAVCRPSSTLLEHLEKVLSWPSSSPPRPGRLRRYPPD
jgi:hypothetical protein